MTDHKAQLHRYLRDARDAIVWKLEGLDEYEARRPMTPTGTNLLGLVKHLAGVEAGYFGFVFERPFPEPIPWIAEDAELNSDLWATPEESRDDLLSLYERTRAHADATIEELDLDATGTVPWWPEERRHPTLHLLLVHMTAETNRHAGHADIVRELIDGTAGLRRSSDNLPSTDTAWWEEHHARVEAAARKAGGR
ncbi:DinB family protein [Nonomuraea endophytica]|uniref:Putative damage-inducible protein DinB n=1 Tax=Nonomuraea endophytica TaxID=714136 RepID=A0A7W8EHE8_9ACTN|nr:DinB family protein [Nonomuraea endophytica]MBB5080875.1 putative damage-inducible protein DinB [Nonomuraea endophytica]